MGFHVNRSSDLRVQKDFWSRYIGTTQYRSKICKSISTTETVIAPPLAWSCGIILRFMNIIKLHPVRDVPFWWIKNMDLGRGGIFCWGRRIVAFNLRFEHGVNHQLTMYLMISMWALSSFNASSHDTAKMVLFYWSNIDQYQSHRQMVAHSALLCEALYLAVQESKKPSKPLDRRRLPNWRFIWSFNTCTLFCSYP